ncbi:hypothetical protein FQR65_LT17675 [Abscondita terminalis]|nr:hypothetical protein FQR65_LT17675 [Abscondita terminalis]
MCSIQLILGTYWWISDIFQGQVIFVSNVGGYVVWIGVAIAEFIIIVYHFTSVSNKGLDSTRETEDNPTNCPDVDMMIVDGPTLVHMLLPEKNGTFMGYSGLLSTLKTNFKNPV